MILKIIYEIGALIVLAESFSCFYEIMNFKGWLRFSFIIMTLAGFMVYIIIQCVVLGVL